MAPCDTRQRGCYDSLELWSSSVDSRTRVRDGFSALTHRGWLRTSPQPLRGVRVLRARVDLRSASRTVLSSLGLTLSRAARIGRPRTFVRILYYHSISEDPLRSQVSPASFASQMEYLRRNHYSVLPLSEVAEHIRCGTPFPDRSVVITLDDGFRDNYDRAFPALKRAQFPATIFLAASYIGTERLPTLTGTDFVPRPLTWDQVREMQRHRIGFGSHTLTHPMLTRISPAQVRHEVRESKRAIEDALGAPVPFFCYPRGDFDEVVKDIVRDEGYLAACTTLPGLNDWKTDLFALRRTYVGRNDTATEFAKKVSGAYDLLQHGLHLWRRIRRRNR